MIDLESEEYKIKEFDEKIDPDKIDEIDWSKDVYYGLGDNAHGPWD